ncbi:GCN5 family acetyltransferase [Xanthomonas cannabis pv. phaseoli]|uniref:GCN5 family acetyltransferase n=1 Tax=Xanthomonas cannabis pv. phaseoli TaxID=1885902 RepID=A0AB34PAD6_9XANT|nr:MULTISPECIES: GNAT family N-acetyltransferase [Xanthomonas]KGK58497.1 GCN5 family acetyltransferase [Xanthomonas cannabis pv. phaseoli]RJS02143.1 GNAT family N-acetyltransferase [Xanthomonas sp. CFBP 7698]
MLIVEQLQAKRHDRNSFSCGEPTLDAYLRRQAVQHHRDGISTTHVLANDEVAGNILGYSTLSAAQLLLTALQEQDRKRLPNYPVPAIRMGRLAVSSAEQGKGYGDYLLAHAVARCLGLREQLGVRVLLVDALHTKAAGFYKSYGFREAAESAMTLYLPLGTS